MSTHMFLWRDKKNIVWIPSLIGSSEYIPRKRLKYELIYLSWLLVDDHSLLSDILATYPSL